MNESIDEAEKRSVASRDKPDPKPDVDWHDGVVIDVQQGNIIKLLPGD